MKLYIKFEADEWAGLRRLAKRECRGEREQLRYILNQRLTEEPLTTSNGHENLIIPERLAQAGHGN